MEIVHPQLALYNLHKFYVEKMPLLKKAGPAAVMIDRAPAKVSQVNQRGIIGCGRSSISGAGDVAFMGGESDHIAVNEA